MNFLLRKIGFCSLLAVGAALFVASGHAKQGSQPVPVSDQANTKSGPGVTVAATSIPGLFDEDYPGPYNVVFHQATKRYAGAIEIEMYPIRRAMMMLQNRAVDCLFIGNDNREFHRNLGFTVSELVFSRPFATNFLRVYSNSDDPLVSRTEDLTSKRVAVSSGTYQGFWFKNNMPKRAASLEVADLATAFDLLAANRVNHVVSFSLDAEVYLEKTDRLDEFASDDSYALAKSNEGIVCWRNNRTTAFIDEVNSGLARR